MKTKLTMIVALLAFNAGTVTAAPLGTAFTYQGRLNDGGNPATGIYDLRFAVYDAGGGGTAVGEPITNSPVGVTNGLFTTTLDFGSGVFTGDARWLEIGVRTNGNSSFTALAPRQALTPAPYALEAVSALTAASVPATNLTGTVPDGRLSTNVAFLSGGASFSGTVNAAGFAGNGGGLTNLNSSVLSWPIGVTSLPVNLGHIDDGGSARGVAVSSNYLYLANNNDGLRVYDVSDPGVPVSLGHANDGGAALGIAVAGHYVYLANADDGLRIYDVANTANPTNVGHINNGGTAWGVAVSGHCAYLANESDGLRIYDISSPTNPVNICHLTNSGPRAVLVAGNYAYVACDYSGVVICDVSDPSNAVKVSSFKVSSQEACNIELAGHYAYVAYGYGGLYIYDVADPANPVSVAHKYDGGAAMDVKLAGNRLYLADLSDGLRTYDITNPTNAVSLGQTYPGGTAVALALAGNLLYLANSGDGLRTYVMGMVTAPAFQGNGSGLTNLNACNLTSGVLPGGRLAGTYSNAVSFNNPANSFAGEGSALTNLNAAALTSGMLSDARLNANVALLNANQNFTGRNNFLTNVGVGTTTPQKRLEVRAQTEADGIRIDGPSTAYPPTLQLSTNGTVGGDLSMAAGTGHFSSDAKAGDIVMRTAYSSTKLLFQNSSFGAALAVSNNMVGIGIVAPAQMLHVTGRIRMGAWTADGATAVYKNASGDFGVQTSDLRLKKNITLIPHALDVVEAMRGVTFNWLREPEGTPKTVGLVAQEVHAALPELTFDMAGEDGQTYLGVHYDKVGAVLVNAVQELNGKVEEQGAELRQKQTEITELKHRVKRLEQLFEARHGGAR